MWNITRLRLSRDRRGASSIIVVVLSLVIVVIVVSNIVLWSYEMNQVDWEKMNEEMDITNVEHATRSSWFVAQSEYTVNTGSRTSGTYTDTTTVDGAYETEFETATADYYSLDIAGPFIVDISTYPLAYIQNIEIQLRYRVDDAGEKWYLKAYNWSSSTYSDSGFNSTTGHTPTTGWDYYAVNFTDKWQNYVQNNGTMYVKLVDEGADGNQTIVDIDFLGVRVVIDGTSFTFKNEGASTSHLVSLWLSNSTNHQRYDINLFVNSAGTTIYLRADVSLPTSQYTVKIVTARGNIAVYSGTSFL